MRPDRWRGPLLPPCQWRVGNHGHDPSMRPLIGEKIENRLVVDKTGALWANGVAVIPITVRKSMRQRKAAFPKLEHRPLHRHSLPST